MRIALLCALLGCLAAADVPVTVRLRSGEQLSGTFAGSDQVGIAIMVGGQRIAYAFDKVAGLDFAATAAPAAAAPVAATQPAGAVIAIPAGTEVLVRTVDLIDSKRTGEGATYQAVLAEPLTIGETVLAPAGANVYLKILQVRKGGRIAGSTSLVLNLNEIMVGTRRITVETQPMQAEGENTAKSTVGKVAAGALIGAAVDGKDGAAKGAMAGGAAAILGNKSSIQIPPKTLLRFALTKPASL